MTEFEIKLEVPAARAKAVQAALAHLGAKAERLRAIYYDTPERLLQREALTLRLRCEGGRWVQTLKGDSGPALERTEHEVDLGELRTAPRPVAARHADSPAGKRLIRVLGQGFDDNAWEVQFETDVQRAAATVTEAGSRIEIAFDHGHVAAGGRKLALSEIEFELKEGAPRAAVELARRWCARHGLWLSTISKAQRGTRLASAPGTFGPAVSAGDTCFNVHASLQHIAGEALAGALDQVTRNASELAMGSTDNEHVHQMRVGIRRTRTAMRELVRRDTDTQEAALVHVFRELGQRRDVSHVLATSAPRLREAGGPLPDEPRQSDAATPASLVRAAPFQEAVLSLLALAFELRDDSGSAGGAKQAVRKRLAKLNKKALVDGRTFERVDDRRQHRVRKRLKRLRYLAEFTAPLHKGRGLGGYLSKLKQVQDALGEYNDAMTALAHYRDVAQRDPRAWFAVGWLTADRPRVAHECGKLLRKLAKTHPFWS